MGDALRNSRSGSTKVGVCGALAFGVLMLAGAGRAADLPKAGRTDDLRMRIAASGATLSDDAMALQRGAGVSRPGFIEQKMDEVPRVLLWDETRILPLLKPAGDGVVTGSGIGR